MTALITTDGSYQVDLRWFYGNGQMLPHDSDFDDGTMEGLWTFDQGTTISRLTGVQRWIKARAVCYSDQSEQKRASGPLVENILYCSEVDPVNSVSHLLNVLWHPPADW
jgi:hypothetical protein